MKIHKPCLVLNNNYSPLLIVNWQRAICLDLTGKNDFGKGVRVIEYYSEEFITSSGGENFPLPAVAVVNKFVKRKRKIALKKRNLLIRDDKTCQYCGIYLKPSYATVDHVVPRSHHSNPRDAHRWDNTVIACFPCNSKKNNRTPRQAGMNLKNSPKEPDFKLFYAGMSAWNTVPDEWKIYV